MIISEGISSFFYCIWEKYVTPLYYICKTYCQRYPLPTGFSSGSLIKNLPSNEGDMGSTPVLGRSPGERNGNPLQYSRLGNPMDRGACLATIHGVTKSQTWLSNWTAAILYLHEIILRHSFDDCSSSLH